MTTTPAKGATPAPKREADSAALERLTAAQRLQLSQARLAARWVGLILPIMLTLVASVVTAAWVPRMPNPMAVHWGPDFEADGFGSPTSNVWLSLGVGVLVTALYFLQSMQRIQPKAAIWGPMYRFLPAIILGTVTFVQVIAVGTAYVQLDYSDARDTPATGFVMLIGFACWVVITLLAYFLQPKLRIDAPASTVAEPLPLAPQERAVWFGEVRPAKSVLWVIFLALAVLLAATIMVFASGLAPVVTWIMLGVALLLFVLTITNTWFHVRIDEKGLEARAVLGWPVYRVAASDVKQVSAVQVNPFAEYGGWGVRLTPQGFGIVLRAGEAIVIERLSRARTFVITVDDAASAAALLAAAAKARHSE